MFILYQIFYGNHPTYCTENEYYDTELRKKEVSLSKCMKLAHHLNV